MEMHSDSVVPVGVIYQAMHLEITYPKKLFHKTIMSFSVKLSLT
jgi:hypothetical protein